MADKSGLLNLVTARNLELELLVDSIVFLELVGVSPTNAL